MIERKVLKERQVELVGDEGPRNVPRQARVTFQRRDFSRALPFVRDRVALAHPEREGRIAIEKKGGGVIVEAEDEHVGLLLGEPFCDRRVAFEERLPVGIGLLRLVERHGDGRHVRCADAADDPCHAPMLLDQLRVATCASA